MSGNSFEFPYYLSEYVDKLRTRLPEAYRDDLNELSTIFQMRDDDTEDYLNTNFFSSVGSGAPTSVPGAGDQYFDSTNNLLYVGNSSNKWVCITPQSAIVATGQTTASTSYTDLATVGPAVTVVTGTKALVTLGCALENNTAASFSAMSVAVSGATTLAAADSTHSVYLTCPAANVGYKNTYVAYLSGLTAGTNVFTAKYRAGANTAKFTDRTLTVVGIP